MLDYEFQSPELRALEEELIAKVRAHQEDKGRIRSELMWKGIDARVEHAARERETRLAIKNDRPRTNEPQATSPDEREIGSLGITSPYFSEQQQQTLDIMTDMLIEFGVDTRLDAAHHPDYRTLRVQGSDLQLSEVLGVLEEVRQAVKEGHGPEMKDELVKLRKTSPRRLSNRDPEPFSF